MIDILIMAQAKRRRDWLEGALRTAPAIRIAGLAPTFPFLKSLMDERPADAMLADLDSTSDDDIAHDWIVELIEIVPIVLLIPVPDGAMFHTLIRAGKGAMLRTDASADQIVHAIVSVSSGLLTFDGTLIPEPSLDDNLSEELTARETEVLHLLAEGLVNREIAGRLNISEHTIKFHIRSILGKLGASTRTEAVTRGLRAGLIEL